MTSRVRLVALACLWLTIAFFVVCVQAVVAQGDDANAALAQQETLESEKDQHVLRLALIIFPIMFVVWLILCSICAYIFICVCPNRYTK
ncbi:hypothetical protein, unknown function [Leishmania braziliensis MHOM/BR/75/M2904]|uniref:Transmembrane protein n=1 Tax=Leishmania braziliensis TaxID=5660 RepID=A4HA85_LEIBR|nr:hypothetical protein, unknown function [Leishmania braziliensis MHOM/BR/75/M2904]KAI5688404.1 hypothetical protein MNV84_02795 [Leishmania braziliensis]CAJ2470814.1 unnamed protein product [Leishmania braziliensis]CAJ2471356.1 unnamed protein product [Leishmania braziliensis]CAM38314.1 hypothetical protein, unknown function [Leishmania braziliensis MHOM/BR/75/M2904]